MSHNKCHLHLYNIQKVLPAVYDDSLSYYELLAKIQYIVKELCAFSHELEDTDNELKEEIEKLAQEFEKFKESGFDDYYKDMIYKWIQRNMPDLISRAIHMVFFGLTDDGYFCAYIPSKWSFVFDTVVDYNSENYGRLVIKY